MFQSSLVASIIATAGQNPDAVALIWHEHEVTYRELTTMAWRARERLAGLDLADGEPIGILAAKSPEAIALVLGALLADQAFLLPAPNHPPQLLQQLFIRAGCRYTLSPEATSHNLAVDPVRVSGEVSFLLTTSGSTGPPKIVPLTVGAVDRFVGWAAGQFAIGPGCRVLNYAPLSFDLCLLDIWTTLARSGTVVLVDSRHAVRSGALARLIAQHEVHVVQAVPMLFGLLTGSGNGVGNGVVGPCQHAFASVKHVVFTGETISPRTVALLPEVFPSAQLYNLYGCTETNDSFLYEVDVAGIPPGPLPLGDPIPGVRSLIVAEDGSVVAGPGVGELWVSTPFQSSGYLGGTGEDGRFTAHPADPAGLRWYRTGDLVRRDPDHTVFLVGRTDCRVKVRGIGVDIGEVERALLGHRQVLGVGVVPVPHPVAGVRLHAVVQRLPDSGLNSLALRQHCASVLPHGAIPDVVRVVDDPLPRTSTGKVDRAAVGRTHVMPYLKGA